jgi:hypothetical protein
LAGGGVLASLNISSAVIPNEMLLRLYDSHGLRHAIYKQGGRETISYLLKTDYIPGDFRKAVDYPYELTVSHILEPSIVG